METERIEIDKFDSATKNFRYIKDSQTQKFERIDYWLEKESQIYKAEVKAKRKNKLHLKIGVGRLPLNNLIKNEIIKNIKEKHLKTEDITEILQIINEYKKYKELSYAFISQIRAISKSRLIYQKNKFDILNKARCSDEVLEKIDKAIIEEITGTKIINLKDAESHILVS